MKFFISIILFFLFARCYSQQETILFVNVKAENVELFGRAAKFIRQNNIKEDSVKTYIINSAIPLLKGSFPECNFLILLDNPHYCLLNDSLMLLYQWNSFQLKKIKESKGFNKIVNANEEEEMTKYFGRVMKDSDFEILKKLQIEGGFRYTLFLNKIEIVNTGAVSGQANIVMHLEIYDKDLKKTFANKLIWTTSLPKGISYDVFKYFIRSAFNDFYSAIKIQLQ